MTFSLSNHYSSLSIKFTAENQLKGKQLEQRIDPLSILPELTPQAASTEPFPLSQQEMEKHSLLERKLISVPDLEPCMKEFSSSERFWLHCLGNFLGGGLITGGTGRRQYDGFKETANFKIWKWLLSHVCNSFSDPTAPEAKQVASILVGLQELESCAERLSCFSQLLANADSAIKELTKEQATKILELKPEESAPMVGGWSNIDGKTGHALIYEFVRIDDQHFDVYLYTATHTPLTSAWMIGDKCKLIHVVLFKKVPEHALFQNRDGTLRPAFIQSVIELNALKAADPNSDVDEKDILKIFSLLEHYRVRVPLQQFGAISGQAGGTCVPSVTKAWMRRHCHELGLYKQLLFPCMQHLMIAGYQAMKERIAEDSFEGSELRRSLRYIAKNIMRQGAKLLEQGSESGTFVSSRQGLQALATAQNLLQNIKQAEKEIFDSKKIVSIPLDLTGIDIQGQLRKRLGPRTVKKGNLSQAKFETQCLPDLMIRLDPSDPVPALKKTLEKCSKFDRRKVYYQESLTLQIHHLVDQLPLPEFKDDWENLSLETQNECLILLDDIVSLYCSHYWMDPQARCYTTFLTLHANIYRLATLIEEQKLSSKNPKARLQYYKVPLFGDLIHHVHGLIYFNRKEFEQTQKVVRFFMELNKRQDGPELFQKEGYKTVRKSEIVDFPGNTSFWNALLSEDEELKKSVEAEGEQR